MSVPIPRRSGSYGRTSGTRVYYASASDLAARHRAALEGRWASTMRFWLDHPDHRTAASPAGGRSSNDPMIAAAMLDRLLHRSIVLWIDGESYRMRAHRAERLRAASRA